MHFRIKAFHNKLSLYNFLNLNKFEGFLETHFLLIFEFVYLIKKPLLSIYFLVGKLWLISFLTVFIFKSFSFFSS